MIQQVFSTDAGSVFDAGTVARKKMPTSCCYVIIVRQYVATLAKRDFVHRNKDENAVGPKQRV